MVRTMSSIKLSNLCNRPTWNEIGGFGWNGMDGMESSGFLFRIAYILLLCFWYLMKNIMNNALLGFQ
jgi:hypothetical protein